MSSTPNDRIVVTLNDLSPEFREELERARDQKGWNEERLRRAVSRNYGFLGPHVTGWIENASDADGNPVEVLVTEFKLPEGRDEQEATVKFRQAHGLCAEGDFTEALPLLRELVGTFPEVSEFHRDFGRVLFELGKFEDALDELLAALSLDPNDSDALVMVGNYYSQIRDYGTAIVQYRRAVKLDETSYGYANLGAALGSLGEITEAEQCFRRALEIEPTYERALLGMQQIKRDKAR